METYLDFSTTYPQMSTGFLFLFTHCKLACLYCLFITAYTFAKCSGQYPRYVVVICVLSPSGKHRACYVTLMLFYIA